MKIGSDFFPYFKKNLNDHEQSINRVGKESKTLGEPLLLPMTLKVETSSESHLGHVGTFCNIFSNNQSYETKQSIIEERIMVSLSVS